MSDELHVESFRSWVAGAALATTLVGAPGFARGQNLPPNVAASKAIEMINLGPYRPTLPIKLVNSRPKEVSAGAIAWVDYDDNSIPRTINIATYTDVFKRASREETGQLEALRNIAAAVAHEQAHVLGGPNEENAYDAQITILQSLGASSTEIGLIRKSRDKSVRAQQDIYRRAREAAKSK